MNLFSTLCISPSNLQYGWYRRKQPHRDERIFLLLQPLLHRLPSVPRMFWKDGVPLHRRINLLQARTRSVPSSLQNERARRILLPTLPPLLPIRLQEANHMLLIVCATMLHRAKGISPTIRRNPTRLRRLLLRPLPSHGMFEDHGRCQGRKIDSFNRFV